MRRLSSLAPAIICATVLTWPLACPAQSAPHSSIPPKAPTAPGSDLLEADQAFTVSAEFRDAKSIVLTYRIAPGYYMYRKRFKFVLAGNQAGLRAAKFPSGKMKHDATFGRVETYRDSVRILLPLELRKNVDGPETLELLATSQGCADAGVCYPPQTHRFKLQTGQSAIVMPESSEKLPFSTRPPQQPSSKLLAPG